MALPFTKKRAAMDDSLQSNLEVIGIVLLAHKLAPAKINAFNHEDIISHVGSVNKTTSIVDAALGPTSEQAAKKKARTSTSRPSCSLPNANDPVDESFLKTLYSTAVEGSINPTHSVICREVLSVRRTISGKVFFQCRHCAHLPTRRERAKCSTVAPQSIDGIYRAMARFMMYHVPACGHIPGEIKKLSPKLSRDVEVAGTKTYWLDSAKMVGLKDGEGGIVYCQPAAAEKN